MIGDKRQAVVTGAAGFIGSHLTDRLVDDGWSVLAYDNLVNGKAENLEPRHAFNKMDIVDDFVDAAGRNFWETLLENVDVVFHLAALGSVPFSVAHPDRVFKSNCDGTRMILEGAAKHGTRVVFASSASYYGDRPYNPDVGEVPKVEGMESRPKNHYAASKVFGEQWGFAFHSMHGLPFTALRFFNVFGPRQRPDSQYAAVVPRFISRSLAGEPMELHGGGGQTRDLTYVSNVVDACLAGVEHGEKTAGQAYNVCAGGRVSIAELAREIGGDTVDSPERPGDIKHSFGSNDKLRRATGWTPRIGWREGIALTTEAFHG